MNVQNPIEKIEEIHKAAVEIHSLSEMAGWAMRNCLDKKFFDVESLSAAEKIEQVRKAKAYFERMLTEMLAFEVRDFDALMREIKAVGNPES